MAPAPPSPPSSKVSPLLSLSCAPMTPYVFSSLKSNVSFLALAPSSPPSSKAPPLTSPSRVLVTLLATVLPKSNVSFSTPAVLSPPSSKALLLPSPSSSKDPPLLSLSSPPVTPSYTPSLPLISEIPSVAPLQNFDVSPLTPPHQSFVLPPLAGPAASLDGARVIDTTSSVAALPVPSLYATVVGLLFNS